jgi:hypothetical protein
MVNGPRTWWPHLAAALAGALFAFWIGGPRLIDPREIDWAMKLDFQYHFLGWHFFRAEPWQWPPGIIRGYYAPAGTSIGFTDSIPLAALALKPFANLLPNPMQYFGVWLVLCFALQGAFGAALTRLWTPSKGLQLVGGVLLIMVPTLLGRVGHPALASHWLLLWALWMYFRESVHPAGWRATLLYGVIAGLIHPYLAVMGFAIVGALAVRRLLEGRGTMLTRLGGSLTPVLTCIAGLVAGWWLSGLLALAGTEDMISTGIDQYSMNVLGPVAPVGWSSLLPELPVASDLQQFEGFQYLGAGLLVLSLVALVLAVRMGVHWRAALPLLIVAIGGALYALSPRVTFGSWVLFDATTPAIARWFGTFRATGRFFWPAAYSLVVIGIGLVATRMSMRAATALLLGVVALQWIDLSDHYRSLRRDVHSEEFHHWPERLKAPEWRTVLPHYDRVILVPPEQCGAPAAPFQPVAVLAATYGLSINTGHVARRDRQAIARDCAQLNADFNSGVVADDAVYLVHRELLQRFRANARQPVVCRELDGTPVCVTARSHERWEAAEGFQ